MEIRLQKFDKISFITFEKVFDQNELDLIWKELRFLCHSDKLLNPHETRSAVDGNNNLLKQNAGVWIDDIYTNRNTSNYLNLYKKSINALYEQKEVLEKHDLNIKLFFATNSDATLLSYYECGDYYKSHIDASCYTYIFWMFKEPKLFTGGNISFSELEYTLNVKSNMAVLFPSWLNHEVDKIEMSDTIEKFECNGRFAFSTFFKMR